METDPLDMKENNSPFNVAIWKLDLLYKLFREANFRLKLIL